MEQAGAVLIDPVELPDFTKIVKTRREVLHYEFKADLNRYLAGWWPKTHVRTMEDVIRFNEEHKVRVMPYFGQELMMEAQEKGPLPARSTCAHWRRTTA